MEFYASYTTSIDRTTPKKANNIDHPPLTSELVRREPIDI